MEVDIGNSTPTPGLDLVEEIVHATLSDPRLTQHISAEGIHALRVLLNSGMLSQNKVIAAANK